MITSGIYAVVLRECKECIREWKNEHGGPLPIQYGDHVNHCWNYGGERVQELIQVLMMEEDEDDTSIRLEYDLMVENVGERQANRTRIGNTIREMREKRELSVRQLAEIAGISYSNLSNIENGRYNVSIDILSRVCAALGCELTIIEREE